MIIMKAQTLQSINKKCLLILVTIMSNQIIRVKKLNKINLFCFLWVSKNFFLNKKAKYPTQMNKIAKN